jgi:hypothetical protein
MPTKISKIEEINNQPKLEGKVKNTPEDFEKMLRVNEFMKEVRRDYLSKSYKPWKAGENIILTQQYTPQHNYNQL